MGANDPNTFAKALANQAAYNNSQYGPTGSFMDKALPVLDFLGGAYGAYQSGAQGGTAIPGLIGLTQGMARRNFLQGMQQRYVQEQAYQQAMNTQRAQDNAAMVHGATGLNVSGYGDPSKYSGLVSHIRENNQNPNINAFLQGEALQVDPYGSANNSLIEKTLARRGTVTDAQYSNPREFVQQGQNTSITSPGALNRALNGNRKSFSGALGMPEMQQDPTQGPLQGGIEAQSAPSFYNNMNPFFLPADAPSNITDLIKAGLTDSQKAQTNAETQRHNQATEGLDRDIHKAKVANQGGYAHYAPNAPNPTEASIARSIYSNDELRAMGYGNPQVSGSKDNQLEYLKQAAIAASNGYGPDSPQAKQAEQTLMNYANNRFTTGMRPVASPIQMQQQMQQAGAKGRQSFAEWKTGQGR